MKKEIKIALVLSVSLLANNCLSQDDFDLDSRHKARVASFKKERQATLKDTEVSGNVFTVPVKVRGDGRITVIKNAKFINKSNLVDSHFVEVECPKRGHRVLIKGVEITNQGRLMTQSMSSASLLNITCKNKGNARVDLINIQVTNNGLIVNDYSY